MLRWLALTVPGWRPAPTQGGIHRRDGGGGRAEPAHELGLAEEVAEHVPNRGWRRRWRRPPVRPGHGAGERRPPAERWRRAGGNTAAAPAGSTGGRPSLTLALVAPAGAPLTTTAGGRQPGQSGHQDRGRPDVPHRLVAPGAALRPGHRSWFPPDVENARVAPWSPTTISPERRTDRPQQAPSAPTSLDRRPAQTAGVSRTVAGSDPRRRPTGSGRRRLEASPCLLRHLLLLRAPGRTRRWG